METFKDYRTLRVRPTAGVPASRAASAAAFRLTANQSRDLILKLATERRLALPFHRRKWVEQGALFSYGPNFYAIGENAATYVDKILKGVKPADICIR